MLILDQRDSSTGEKKGCSFGEKIQEREVKMADSSEEQDSEEQDSEAVPPGKQLVFAAMIQCKML